MILRSQRESKAQNVGRSRQGTIFFFLNLNACGERRGGQPLVRGRTPIGSCESLENSLEDSVLKTGDVCAAGQEIENVHDTFQEVLAEVFVQRAEGY